MYYYSYNLNSNYDSRLLSCVCYYQFLTWYNKSSSHINDISKCSMFSLSVQSAVILIHRLHLRLETFKLQQTEMACLMVLKTKLIVNHLSFGNYKTKQVKSSIDQPPLYPQDSCMIASLLSKTKKLNFSCFL